MHWLLDVHFQEDKTKVWDMNVQQNLNIMRKIINIDIKSVLWDNNRGII